MATRPIRWTDDQEHLIGPVQDIPTEQLRGDLPTPEELRRVMSALGRIGGPIGGKARAAKLSKKRRSDIAKLAAKARWSVEEKE